MGSGTTIRLSQVPPSTNHLFLNVAGRGRVKSPTYKLWQDAMGWELKRARPAPFQEPVHIDIGIGKLRANADLSNRIKAIEDLLVLHKVIPGDSIQWVKGISVYLAPEPFEGVDITIYPALRSIPVKARDAA